MRVHFCVIIIVGSARVSNRANQASSFHFTSFYIPSFSSFFLTNKKCVCIFVLLLLLVVRVCHTLLCYAMLCGGRERGVALNSMEYDGATEYIYGTLKRGIRCAKACRWLKLYREQYSNLKISKDKRAAKRDASYEESTDAAAYL